MFVSVSTQVLSIKGGGKRGRAVADDDVDAEHGTKQWSIQPVIGEMVVRESDPPQLVEMIRATEYDIDAILGNMSLEDINKVHTLIMKWKGHLRKDTAIKAIAEVVGAFQRVQDSMDLQNGVAYNSAIVLVGF